MLNSLEELRDAITFIIEDCGEDEKGNLLTREKVLLQLYLQGFIPRGEYTLNEIGYLLGRTREAIRMCEQTAKNSFKAVLTLSKNVELSRYIREAHEEMSMKESPLAKMQGRKADDIEDEIRIKATQERLNKLWGNRGLKK